MSIVIDCTSRPSIAALRAADVVAVCRYLSWDQPNTQWKLIRKPEFDETIAAGIGVCLNWEYDARDWLGGAAAGIQHGREAVRQARALGYPAGHVILGSADWDMTRTEWDSAGHGYAAGFVVEVTGGGYLPGVYGPWDVLTWCHDAGLMDIYWQAGMSWAWSGGRNANAHPAAHLFQQKHMLIGGIDCDVNVILQPQYGAYRLGEPAMGEDEMDAEQARMLYNLDRLNTALLLGQDKVTKILGDDGQYHEYDLDFVKDLNALKTTQSTGVDPAVLSQAVRNAVQQAFQGARIEGATIVLSQPL